MLHSGGKGMPSYLCNTIVWWHISEFYTQNKLCQHASNLIKLLWTMIGEWTGGWAGFDTACL